MRKLPRILKANPGLKLLSLLLAIVIWHVVVGHNDPVITRSFQVKVKVTNESYIKSGKQIYSIDDTYKTVVVYLKTNRSILRKISADDIQVKADLTQIVDMNTDPVMVPLSVTCSGVSRSDITLSRTAIPIKIDNMSSKEYPVTVDMGKSVPYKDYEVGETTPDPERVVINGPESIIQQVDSVVAEIDVSNMMQDGECSAELHLYDKDQNKLSENIVKDDITFDGGKPDVKVEVKLWRKKSDVSITAKTSGTPASGYEIAKISTTPETVTVAGSDKALAQLEKDGNQISIPGKYISVSGASSDVTKEVDFEDILPENLKLSSNAAESATVSVTILPKGSREIELDVDDLQKNNLKDGMTVSYDQDTIGIFVRGNAEKVRSLTASGLTASIDLSNRGEGDYTLPVSVVLPEGIRMVHSVSIQVHVKRSAKTLESGRQSAGTSG